MMEPVDSKYASYIMLILLLQKLDIIEMGMRKHVFSPTAMAIGSVQPKPHWIKMAVVTTNIEYLDIFAMSKKDAKANS